MSFNFNNAVSVKGHDDDHLLSQGFSDVDRPKDWKSSGKDENGKDTFVAMRRILTPVSAQSRIYVPLRQKTDNDPKGTMIYLAKDKNNSFVVPEILKFAMKADLDVKARLKWDMGKTRSIFAPMDLFMYLVFCREHEDGKKDTVFVAEYPKSVAKGIHSVGHKEHPKFKVKSRSGGGEKVTALLNGPVLLYDLILTKIVGKSDPRFNTNYEVDADIDNKWSGQVPVDVYKYGYPENFPWSKVFTESEQASIETFIESTSPGGDLLGALEKKVATLITPEEEITRIIHQFNADSTDNNGAPLLPDIGMFMKSFADISGINLLGTSVPVGQIEGKKQAADSFDDTEDIEEAEEASFEEVPDEDDANFFTDEKEKEDSFTDETKNSDEEDDDPFA